MDKAAEEVQSAITNGIDLIREGAGINATLVTFIVQICATLVLFLIVRFFLWNKVTSILDKRKASIENAINEKNQIIDETNKLKEEANNIISQANLEAENLKTSILSEAEKESSNIISDANIKAKQMIEDAKVDIDEQYQNAEGKIKEEIISVAYELARKITGDNISEEKNEQLVKDFFNEEEKND